MSDNVIRFPSRGLDIEVELEDEQVYWELVSAVHTMLEMNVAGMVGTSDVEWDHIMDAAMSLGISAGLRAGFTPEELQDMLASAKIEEVEYDA